MATPVSYIAPSAASDTQPRPPSTSSSIALSSSARYNYPGYLVSVERKMVKSYSESVTDFCYD